MIIKNGIVADPASGLYEHMDILIKNGKIEIIAPEITDDLNNDSEVIDASGMIVGPGLIDTHVHFRDPGFTYKEDIHTGALAAAKGGFTTVVCMANTLPTVDNVDTLKDNLARGAKENIRIYQAAAISHSLKGQEEVDMTALKAAGACGFTDDGIPLLNAEFCYNAMEAAARLDMPVSLHEEDSSFIRNNGINHGKVSEKLGIYGSPSIAEESLVARDCLLALRSGADVVIQHISSGISVDLIRTYKKLGAKLHAEATPHHFTLTEDAVLEHGTLAKMNPPLRTENDRKQIIEGLIDGTIDLIATDHAPHSAEEKSKPITEAPSGIIGLETSLALGITSLVKPGHLSILQLLEKMTVNPAKLYHMPYGTISEDADADLVIFDPDEKWTPTEYVSKSSNTPFTGMELTGKVKYTVCGGNVVYSDR
ncbi:dihydroorotase [Agathobacter sp.]